MNQDENISIEIKIDEEVNLTYNETIKNIIETIKNITNQQ
jgi:hypothetical protein